jgi:hypothetical protein
MNCQYNGCGDEGVLRDGGVFLCDYHDHGHLGPDYSEGWAHGREEVASLKAQLAAVEKERDEARAMAYVPGLRECAKCGCTLVTTTIHVPSGNLSVDRKPKDCPNGCGPTWPVTERQAANRTRTPCRRCGSRARRSHRQGHRLHGRPCTKAETERDAATGALAEAMVVLSRLMDEGDVEPASAFRASPAADLAARHDAEIERRALLSAITFVWGLYAKAPQLSGSLIAKTMERKFPQALALLTPEKP